jgi:predicted DNA-binding ribbon-helix-helix protein
MKSLVVKRSIVIASHKTSVSLEDAFWEGLKEIARARSVTLSDLVAAIDSARRHGNLSSAIRLFVLDFYRNQLAAIKEGRDDVEGQPAMKVEEPEKASIVVRRSAIPRRSRGMRPRLPRGQQRPRRPSPCGTEDTSWADGVSGESLHPGWHAFQVRYRAGQRAALAGNPLPTCARERGHGVDVFSDNAPIHNGLCFSARHRIGDIGATHR